MPSEEAIRSVVQVGEGRGFVVEGRGAWHIARYIVTAAHCLPHLPDPASDEHIYRNLVGPLKTKEPKIWAMCLFADPLGDIAVLGADIGLQNTTRCAATC